MKTTKDIAGQAHWDDTWSGNALPPPIDPIGSRLSDYVSRRLQKLYDGILAEFDVHPGASLIEMGCGGSVWMPYFASRHGLRVSGVDYSPTGCKLSQRILQRAGVVADIHECDFFHPPTALVGAADVVFSSGVLEHFTDTAGCVAAMAAYVKPGGLVISSVPNMAGLTGSLQRIFDRETYDIHVPLDLSQLVDAHKDAGLLVQRSEYVLFANVGVVAIKSKARELRTLAKRASLGVAARINMILWLLEGPDGRLPPNPWTSPYILCVARKPSARE